MKKLRALVLVAWTIGLMTESSSASFQDCYTKCFIFCMIEPSQTLCSCTTRYLKDCIFPETPVETIGIRAALASANWAVPSLCALVIALDKIQMAIRLIAAWGLALMSAVCVKSFSLP